jgi:exopolysaccharide biosynthesis polyprenyl glycosylphosphotransferase
MNAKRRLLVALLNLLDLGVVIAAFIFSVALTAYNAQVGPVSVLEMRLTVQNALFLGLYVLVWQFILRGFGLYDSYRLAPPFREVRDLSLAVLVAVFPLVPLGVVLNFEYASPAFLSVFAVSALLGLATERGIIRALARRLRQMGVNLRNVVVIGEGKSALELASGLARRSDLGYHVVEIVHVSAQPETRERNQIHDRVEQLIEANPVDEVFLAVPFDSWQPLIRNVVRLCDEQGVCLRIMASVGHLTWGRAVIDEVAGNPMLTVFSGPAESFPLLAKRAIDLVAALIGILVFSPLFLLIALAIRLDSTGPVIFAQERVGQNRRRFHTYKFRTMVADASKLQASLEHLNEAKGPVFKIRQDPRITRVGSFLRRASLDELPQLLNVLKGDMSLVGPRPLPVRDVERIDVRWHKRRFSVRPGITCLWQASSREPEFDQWIKADIDLKILLRTIPAVLTRQGAH